MHNILRTESNDNRIFLEFTRGMGDLEELCLATGGVGFDATRTRRPAQVGELLNNCAFG
jgi:hypothetical protein